MPLGPSNHACMHPFCTIHCNRQFAKSIGKICIFCLWPLLASYMLHRLLYRMALRRHFCIFASHLASFCEKMLAALCGKHDSESGTKARYASWALQLSLYAPFLHHVLQPEICKIHLETYLCFFCLWPLVASYI